MGDDASASGPVFLGKFQLLGQIATGPVAYVYEAKLDGIAGFSRRYAVKRVRDELAAVPEITATLEDAARNAASLAHSNIAQVLDLDQEAGHLYWVLEWVQGWSLGQALETAWDMDMTMPTPHALWLGLQILSALEYVHNNDEDDAPKVHGALSTSNVLISRAGTVKLSDFGTAWAANRLAEGHPTLIETRGEQFAPEQLDGETTAATDLFATARILYTALAGADPFADEGSEPPLDALRAREPKPLAECRSDLAEGLCDVIMAGLSKDPSERPENATAFKRVLADALRLEPTVFSQETLAAWLVDVFGEPSSVPANLSDVIQQIDDDDLIADPDGGDLGDLELALENPDKTTPAVHHDPLPQGGASFADEEEKTAVGGFQVLPPTAQPATWEEEGATIVNPDIAKKLAELREAKAAGFEAEAPTRLRTSLPEALANLDIDLDAIEPEQASSLGAAGAATAFGMLCAGILLGALAMWGWNRSGDLNLLSPMLEVRTAPGVDMNVTVDGTPIQDAHELAPGNHVVRVDIAGAEPWEVDLALQAGEYRLMVIEADRIQFDPDKARAENQD